MQNTQFSVICKIQLNQSAALLVKIFSLCILILIISCSSAPKKYNLVAEKKLAILKQKQSNILNWELVGKISVNYKKQYTQFKYNWYKLNEQNIIEIKDYLGRLLVGIEGKINNFSIHYYEKDLKNNRFFSYFKSYLPLLFYWVRNIPAPDLDLDTFKFNKNIISELQQEDWKVKFLKFTSHNKKKQYFSKLIIIDNQDLGANVRFLVSRQSF